MAGKADSTGEIWAIEQNAMAFKRTISVQFLVYRVSPTKPVELHRPKEKGYRQLYSGTKHR